MTILYLDWCCRVHHTEGLASTRTIINNYFTVEIAK